MAVLSQKQIDAKRELGTLLMKLRLESNMRKMSELAPKCGMTVNELHKLEGGRGHFPEALIRKVLVEVEADAVALVKADGYLKTIHPRVPKNKTATVPAPSLVPAFA